MEEAAKDTLNLIYNSHPDFKPTIMDDGNYLIEYSRPAFTIVFRKEYECNWDYIEANHIKGLCNDEVLIDAQGRSNFFDKTGKICLFGRAKMFMDAQEPIVVKMFNPS